MALWPSGAVSIWPGPLPHWGFSRLFCFWWPELKNRATRHPGCGGRAALTPRGPRSLAGVLRAELGTEAAAAGLSRRQALAQRGEATARARVQRRRRAPSAGSGARRVSHPVGSGGFCLADEVTPILPGSGAGPGEEPPWRDAAAAGAAGGGENPKLGTEAGLESEPLPERGYEVHGLEKIPEGPGLVIFYHGATPVDYFYFLAKLLILKNRMCYTVADHFVFKLPGFKLLLDVFGVMHGPKEECVKALKNGHLVAISPGGVREALFSDETYVLVWGNRMGFAQVAIDAKVPIIPMFTQNVREGIRTLGGISKGCNPIFNRQTSENTRKRI
ncbi:uncharacterized protein LOC119851054 isoform X4 [Dermochelys coriacea]|uniref:uncharacterized protein LOC119851054 isoform X4 n=1 Tax=Dermochelys coriacea TaxID=27794 RepID=UPI0018E76189|nr:uncharacterized protein LOC119851054 isoform X4 [Dermochelys coriacea]